MAGEWIKFEHATLDKPEVMRIARTLGVSRDHVIGMLIRLWVWLDRNCVDGRVDGVESLDVDDLVTCPGLSACLKDVGWVQIDDVGRVLTVHHFSRHNGETSKKRALKNERQSRWRRQCGDAKPSTKASTREEKRRSTKPPTPKSAPSAPPGVGDSVWADWVSYRGKKLTTVAYRRQCSFLAAQPDPNACVEQSLRNTWAGLFPVGNGSIPPDVKPRKWV